MHCIEARPANLFRTCPTLATQFPWHRRSISWEKLLNDSGVADLALVGSGQTFGSYLEEKIAIGLREMLEESGIDSYYVASKSSSSGARQKSAFELTSYWPFMSAPGVTENPEIETVYKRMGRGHLIQPDVVV